MAQDNNHGQTSCRSMHIDKFSVLVLGVTHGQQNRTLICNHVHTFMALCLHE